MKPRPLLPVLLRSVAFAALLLSPVADAGSPPLGAESPEELVVRFNQATGKGEVATRLSLLSPTARSLHTLSLLFATAMVAAMQEMEAPREEGTGPGALEAELDAILRRHGFAQRMEAMQGESPLEADTEEERDRRLAKLFDGIDTIALATGLEALIKKAGGGSFRPTTWEISDPRIESERGTVAAGDQRIDIVRIDGRWYLEPKGPPPSGASNLPE